MSDKTVYVSYEGVIERETEKAIGIGYDDKVHVWIPKSQIGEIELSTGEVVDLTGVEVGDEILSFTIPRWLADKNELDYEEE